MLRACLFVVALCCALIARAQTEPLTAYTVPVFPWTYPNQPDRGVSPEILQFLFRSANIPIKLETLPYVRVINGLRDGSNVAAVLIPDAERDGFASRLCQIGQIRSGIVYKRKRFASLEPKQLSNLIIGVPRGTRALDKLSKQNATLYPLESVEQGLKMLVADRLDASFVSQPGSVSALEKAGLDVQDYPWLEIEVQPVVIYISQRSPLMADHAALARLKAACEGPAQAKMAALLQQYR
ncbi:substrate-binding periplasmic protein [Chitinimonas sp.]|uniref:substrate-binding periplasmic protein n=1 Tax=Chitinimonas sp. TaxID=1934313 RepID=UPI0035AFDB67